MSNVSSQKTTPSPSVATVTPEPARVSEQAIAERAYEKFVARRERSYTGTTRRTGMPRSESCSH